MKLCFISYWPSEWGRMLQQLRIQEVLVTELTNHKEIVMGQLHELQDVVLDMAYSDESSYATVLEQVQHSLLDANIHRDRLAMELFELRTQMVNQQALVSYDIIWIFFLFFFFCLIHIYIYICLLSLHPIASTCAYL